MPHHTSVKPPWAALQAFVSVAQQGSAAGAADALGVTPSAVSHQLAILESCLGAQLLDRSARPMQLTALGQSYAQRLIPGFDLIQDATSALFPKRTPSQCFVTSYPLSDAAPVTLQHHIVVHADALARPAVRAALQWLVDVASGHTDTPALP